ncbi:MAG: hypothetical protein ABJL33_15345 [Hyphomicrobiales bacterium]|uniref:hypothetical protein n=1 Tax=Roseibium polysiphoniae TaxID=2571221 RepID=UPI003296AB4B
MSSTSSGVERAPWGQAPLELETNYARIKSIVESTPSLRAAFGKIQNAGLVTVKYDAFAKAWNKLKARKAEDDVAETAIVEKVAANPVINKPRKSLPSISKFSVATGPEGTAEQW